MHSSNPSYEGVDFNPARFLRCHSRNNDATDTSTQLWGCQFEPSIESPPQTTDTVATCGGYSICLIENSSGKIIMKYNSNNKAEMYYCLTWVTLTIDGSSARKINVLAVGGSSGCIELFHPASCVRYKQFAAFRNAGVSSVCTHDQIPQRLFCSSMNGEIAIWDIGIPAVPDYTVKPNLLYSIVLGPEVQVFQIAYNSKHAALLAAASDGLYALRVQESPSGEFRSAKLFIDLAASSGFPSKTTVDTISVISDDLVAAKPVGAGKILIFRLNQLEIKETARRLKDLCVVRAKTCAFLQWNTTQECFMNMAVNSGGNGKFLACGDNSGTVWVYDISEIAGNNSGTTGIAEITPLKKLAWPKTADPHIELNNKLPIQASSVIVDNVAWSANGGTLVAVTSRNLVCFWERA